MPVGTRSVRGPGRWPESFGRKKRCRKMPRTGRGAGRKIRGFFHILIGLIIGFYTWIVFTLTSAIGSFTGYRYYWRDATIVLGPVRLMAAARSWNKTKMELFFGFAGQFIRDYTYLLPSLTVAYK
jgi:hypothetical protein